MHDDADARITPTAQSGTFTVTVPTTIQTPAHTVPSVTADVSGNTAVMNWEWIADIDFSGYEVVVSTNNANPTCTALYSDNAKMPGNVIQLIFPRGATPTPTPTSVPAPVGAFSADPLSGTTPLTVKLTYASTSQITSWLRDADNDGTVDCTTKNCSYSYASDGTYTVKLAVSRDGGFDNVLRTGYVPAITPPQTPTQAPAPVAGCA